MIKKSKYILILIFFLGGYSFLSLLNPDSRENAESFYKVTLPMGLSYVFNMDNTDFVRLVTKYPKGFLAGPIRTRLNRPLYSTLVYPVYKLVLPFMALPQSFEKMIMKNMSHSVYPENWEGVTPRQVAASWLAHILLNLILMGIISMILLGAFEQLKFGVLAFPLAILPLVSTIFKNQVILPHTTIFNLLLPAIAFYLIVKTNNKPLSFMQLFLYPLG